jgi:hypothetical protein
MKIRIESMENIEERKVNPISISSNIPEEDLILMFPYTYVEYRVIMSTDDSLSNLLNPEKEIPQSFKSFLSFMGPVPEDTHMAH